MEALKVWIYSANRPFSTKEVAFIENNAEAFLNNWDSHGTLVPGEITIEYNHFIVVKAGDVGERMCGSAQSKPIKLIQELDEQLDLGLLDRMTVEYKDENNEVKSISMASFKEVAKSGDFSKDTVVFNNMLVDGADYPTKWEVKASESWHGQFL